MLCKSEADGKARVWKFFFFFRAVVNLIKFLFSFQLRFLAHATPKNTVYRINKTSNPSSLKTAFRVLKILHHVLLYIDENYNRFSCKHPEKKTYKVERHRRSSTVHIGKNNNIGAELHRVLFFIAFEKALSRE